jgi:hypothetical protein
MGDKLQTSTVLFPGGGGHRIGGCDDLTFRLDGVEKSGIQFWLPSGRDKSLVTLMREIPFLHFNLLTN